MERYSRESVATYEVRVKGGNLEVKG